ncbi:alpha/beta fold hydrolase [Dawidia soli]|uniref:Alpha/beta hydrolase n=1 Tax=Dawidia soli TaxID=2782352 RepID=A0AAP2DER4_9BACT|nr:alpha/beta hydrolase [Dawidia soli]MBT1689927.1 alpha/beta hydrolase [Dawidia soli]
MKQQHPVHCRMAQAEGLEIFYREAGPAEAPVVLLLHGFPTSSFMFRNLIPVLSTQYRVIAPDLPGFGCSAMPPREQYTYTFDNLAHTLQAFIDTLALKRFAIYVFDYGAPVGYRLAIANPEKITAIISQNGNAYEEGLSQAWTPIQRYWQDPANTNREALRQFVTLELTRFQYEEGVPDKSLIAPETYTLDQYFLDRPGNADIQLDLMGDYKNNVARYPEFQQYFRDKKPPLLATWGDKDPFFLPAGADAYKRDIPNARVRFYDTGHFALETHHTEIAREILDFLEQAVKMPRTH